jgi:hypothetical protein
MLHRPGSAHLPRRTTLIALPFVIVRLDEGPLEEPLIMGGGVAPDTWHAGP